MVASIELDDEEKIQVLLVALALFLFALFISLCLALACCPLNQWLTARAHKKRRHPAAPAQARVLPYSRLHNRNLNLHYASAQAATNKLAPPIEHMGPPPAYEAALRATRLQSLTGNCLFPVGEQQQQSPDWLKTALSNSTSEALFEGSQQLDLGDYFHQPREYQQLYGFGAPLEQPAARSARVVPRSAPVMLRLWVKLMEPGELVERARAHSEATTRRRQEGTTASAATGEPGAPRRRVSLARQASIPQLLGALMTTLARSKSGGAICAEPSGQARAEPTETQLSSLTSSADSSEEPPPPATAATVKRSRRHSIPPIASSITSRVLHMNVASFSYVKDENLISTKKHNQLNFHHFYATNKKQLQAHDNNNNNNNNKSGKMCQLLVSICDVENLLGSTSLNARASARLAQHSSVYVRCEILAPKTSNLSAATARLIRNPLKVLTHQQSSTDTPPGSSTPTSGQHTTLDFASTLPAAAMDPLPAACRTSVASGEPEAEVDGSQPPGWRHEPAAEGKSIVVFNSIPKQIAQQQQLACSSATPSAAGSGHFSLSDTNEQLQQLQQQQQQQQQQQTTVDLIQFDSVFVSPILSKSTLEQGHIRLRIFSQCRYVNETCLAELKLPLKQLMRAQTRDNLADADRKRAVAQQPEAGDSSDEQQQQQQQQNQQRQADLILDNLLANLVTASTGSPLGTLIEQISAEAREDSDPPTRSSEHTPTRTGSFRLANWLAGADNNKEEEEAGTNLQRASNSLGAALNYLGGGVGGVGGVGGEEEAEAEVTNWQSEWHSRMIERNYCRSLMVSHWLNYLVAPSYECQLIEEVRAKLVLGLTYLPTSNRIIFNAHRASIESLAGDSTTSDKQAIKKLRLQTNTSYLLRFLMLAEGRVLKRKQTACGRKPEWDSQEPVTFDLVNVHVSQPSFVVALVMRNSSLHSPVSHAPAGGSLQSLALSNYQHKTSGSGGALPVAAAAAPPPPSAVQSEPESVYRSTSGGAGATCRPGAGSRGGVRRDLVIGHLVLADEIWSELRAQPRRQIIRQFKLL